MRLVISDIVLVFALFPYVGISAIPSDIQPFCFLAGICWFIIAKKIHVTKTHKTQLLIAFISLTFFFLNNTNSIIAIRSITGYVSFTVLNIIFYNSSKSTTVNINKILKLSILLWFTISLVQLSVNRYFLTDLIPHARIGEERGVTGLAPEPSYLAITGVYFYLISNYYLKEKLYSIVSISLVLFSQSMFGIILLIPFVLGSMIKKSIKIGLSRIFILISIIVFALVLINKTHLNFFSPRLIQVTSYLIKNPFDFFFLDSSSSDRISHVYFSFKGFIENLGMPHGFNSWKEYALLEFNKSSFKWITTGRIMSTYGSILFELGIFGLIFILSIWKQINTTFKNKRIYSLGFNFMLLFAIPLSTPLIPLILNLNTLKSND